MNIIFHMLLTNQNQIVKMKLSRKNQFNQDYDNQNQLILN